MDFANIDLTGQDASKRKYTVSPKGENIGDLTSTESQVSLHAHPIARPYTLSTAPVGDVQHAIGQAPSRLLSSGQDVHEDVSRQHEGRTSPYRHLWSCFTIYPTREQAEEETHIPGWRSYAYDSPPIATDPRALPEAHTPMWEHEPAVDAPALAHDHQAKPRARTVDPRSIHDTPANRLPLPGSPDNRLSIPKSPSPSELYSPDASIRTRTPTRMRDQAFTHAAIPTDFVPSNYQTSPTVNSPAYDDNPPTHLSAFFSAPTKHDRTPTHAATPSAFSEPSTVDTSSPADNNSPAARRAAKRKKKTGILFTVDESIFLLQEFAKLGRKATKEEAEGVTFTFNERFSGKPARTRASLLAKRRDLLINKETCTDAIARLQQEVTDKKERVAKMTLPPHFARDWMRKPIEAPHSHAAGYDAARNKPTQISAPGLDDTETDAMELDIAGIADAAMSDD